MKLLPLLLIALLAIPGCSDPVVPPPVEEPPVPVPVLPPTFPDNEAALKAAYRGVLSRAPDYPGSNRHAERER